MSAAQVAAILSWVNCTNVDLLSTKPFGIHLSEI